MTVYKWSITELTNKVLYFAFMFGGKIAIICFGTTVTHCMPLHYKEPIRPHPFQCGMIEFKTKIARESDHFIHCCADWVWAWQMSESVALVRSAVITRRISLPLSRGTTNGHGCSGGDGWEGDNSTRLALKQRAQLKATERNVNRYGKKDCVMFFLAPHLLLLAFDQRYLIALWCWHQF